MKPQTEKFMIQISFVQLPKIMVLGKLLNFLSNSFPIRKTEMALTQPTS